MSVPIAIPIAVLLAFSVSTPASASTAQPDSASAAKAPIAAPLPPDSAMIRATRNAILGLNIGQFLAFTSIWTIPGIYDIGFLTMMGSKKTLKNQYVKRYHEDPTEFGQTGDNAYWQGWAMKGGAVATFIVMADLTEEPVLAVMGFAILWLGGTFKHYEASRMLYEQSRHYENGILDENPPLPGQGAARGRERFTLRYATAF